MKIINQFSTKQNHMRSIQKNTLLKSNLIKIYILKHQRKHTFSRIISNETYPPKIKHNILFIHFFILMRITIGKFD